MQLGWGMSGALALAVVLSVLPAPAGAQTKGGATQANVQRVAVPAPSLPQPATTQAARPSSVLAAITLADIGFINGFRFANLGGRREVFVPIPQGGDITPSALELVIDDISAHEARRNLEVLVNDRSVLAVSLDGKSQGRSLRVALAKTKPRDGFVKLTLLYSGAATQDRCIDVRSVGDSLTIRPETALEMEIGQTPLDVTATVALMPREVTIVLPRNRLAAQEIATALTVARALAASGRRISFHQGHDSLTTLSTRSEANRWIRSVVVVGAPNRFGAQINGGVTLVAGPPMLNSLSAIRIADVPALLVSDSAAGRLLASPLLAAARGVVSASVGETLAQSITADRITFDELAVEPVQAEVFGRAELATAVDLRRLPAGRYPERLLLDLMVAPDGSGEKAVASAYVNERLLGSAVAPTNGATRLDLMLPEGLVGARANVKVVVQRPSVQGDCRFEPQGYPAQILGSSAFVLASATGKVDDFSDLARHWNKGTELLLPVAVADRPAQTLGLLVGLLNAFSPEIASVTVRLQTSDAPQAPSASFIAVGATPPPATTPRVRFDRGRVVVADRTGRVVLDLDGFASGAVVQLVSSGEFPGLWVKPMAADGTLPDPGDLKLDRGDVAFIDRNSVALAMSTERDTLVQVAYPELVSWFAVAERFRPWVLGSVWLVATLGVLLVLQRIFRRRSVTLGDE